MTYFGLYLSYFLGDLNPVIFSGRENRDFHRDLKQRLKSARSKSAKPVNQSESDHVTAIGLRPNIQLDLL